MDDNIDSVDTPMDGQFSSQLPQVRARITVVCAECKRLKLKCDRQKPCSSCVKRDTVSKCQYSTAAAERVDLHSLNNRLILVESALSSLTSGQFTSTYQPQLLSMLLTDTKPSIDNVPAKSAQPTGRLLSLSIPLHDMISLLPEDASIDEALQHQDEDDVIQCKPEADTHNLLLPPTPTSESWRSSSAYSPEQSSTSQYHRYEPSLPPLTFFYLADSGDVGQSRPKVTAQLLNLLPAASSSPTAGASPTAAYTLDNLMNLAEHATMHTCPVLSWPAFRWRALDLAAKMSTERQREWKADKARKILFGQPIDYERRISLDGDLLFYAAICACLAIGVRELRERHLSATGGMAVDAMANPLHGHPDAEYWYALSNQALGVYDTYMTSQSAEVEQATDGYNLEYLIACSLQVRYILHDRSHPLQSFSDGLSPREQPPHRIPVGGILFPLIGKMVNVARQVGLNQDPDEGAVNSGERSSLRTRSAKSHKLHSEASSPYTPFIAEMRRRIWWDIVCYDLFLSDAMGHEPLIAHNSFTTKIPCGDVDEEAFGPSSAIIPMVSLTNGNTYTGGIKSFEIKCRLAQLFKSIKERARSPELALNHSHRYGVGTASKSTRYTIDYAASLETEIRAWLSDLPAPYKLDLSTATEVIGDTIHEGASMGQRCDIAIAANRMIMAIYLPFLEDSRSKSSALARPHQAAHGILDAAHAIIVASQQLHILWNTHGRRWSVSPDLLNIFPLSRTLLDATLVCAATALIQPTGILAMTARDNVNKGREVLEDDFVWIASNGLGRKTMTVRRDCARELVSAIGGMLSQPKKKNLPPRNGSTSSESVKDSVSSPSYEDSSSIVSRSVSIKSPILASNDRHEKLKKPGSKRSYPSVGVRTRPSKEDTPASSSYGNRYNPLETRNNSASSTMHREEEMQSKRSIRGTASSQSPQEKLNLAVRRSRSNSMTSSSTDTHGSFGIHPQPLEATPLYAPSIETDPQPYTDSGVTLHQPVKSPADLYAFPAMHAPHYSSDRAPGATYEHQTAPAPYASHQNTQCVDRQSDDTRYHTSYPSPDHAHGLSQEQDSYYQQPYQEGTYYSDVHNSTVAPTHAYGNHQPLHSPYSNPPGQMPYTSQTWQTPSQTPTTPSGGQYQWHS